MIAAVTGATGFLGRRLVLALLNEGIEVRCLVRPGSDTSPLLNFIEPELGVPEFVRVELHDQPATAAALAGTDVLYHVAAGLTGSTSVLFLNSVIPTRHLIAAALVAKTPRFVHISSLGVYGAGHLISGSTLDENTPVDPLPHLRDAYTYSKIVQEQVAWRAHAEQGLPLVVIRPGVIYGPGRGALSGRVGLQLGSILLRMGGGQSLPYTFVENCAEGIMLAGLKPGVEGQAFNLVDDDLPTGKRILKMYRKAGHPVRNLWVPRFTIQPLSRFCHWYHRYSQGQIPGVITAYRSAAMWKSLKYTNQKARASLNWNPRILFDEGFQRSLESADTPTAGAS